MSTRHTTSPRDAAAKALLSDPALTEALSDPMGFERLSDADVHAMRARRRQRIGMAGTLALVFAVGAGSWWQLRPGPAPIRTEHFATARGEHATVELADGSTLTLDGATRVDVTLAPDRRTVALTAGEAYFDVAHDPARPFTVEVGGSSARVLGTAFDLDLTRGRVDLAVYRGAVRFGRASGDPSAQVVRAGWRSRFSDGEASSPKRFDVTREGWRQGWLDTDGMRLGDVVEALNRQGGPVVLPPPATLVDVPIAGRFRLDDPAMLLDAIGDAYGFRVRRDEDALRLEPHS
jgi:transmembrane sensor